MKNVASAVTSPAIHNGMPNSRLNPTAAPRNSARSVAMATTSISSHSPITTQRGNRSRQCSARFFPVAMPSLADSDCSRMAMRLLATMTQHRR